MQINFMRNNIVLGIWALYKLGMNIIRIKQILLFK